MATAFPSQRARPNGSECSWPEQMGQRATCAAVAGRFDRVKLFDVIEPAVDRAADRVYEFFFTGLPLNLTGDTGSPINPLAIK